MERQVVIESIHVRFDDGKVCGLDDEGFMDELRFEKLKEYWDRMVEGGRKSFTFDET